jgi:hypothetical protein
MSEYQYYEFQAVDRPLTEGEIEKLRSRSSRATITASRFVNHYEWGSFKGDPAGWMERYFDAFLYLANWGTHELMLRFPQRVLDLDTVNRYCPGGVAAVRAQGDLLLLELLSEGEGSAEWDDGSGWLSSLIPLRADLAGGDHRALYLAWLLCVQAGQLDDDETEPPIPAGLGEPNAALQAFADFLRLDSDLLAVAAACSPKTEKSAAAREVEKWIAALPEDEKTAWLVRLAGGKEPQLRAELLGRFRAARPTVPSSAGAPRSVGELLAAAERCAEERRRKEAERTAAERARREREAAAARDLYLSDLARREDWAWRHVDDLIATKQPGRYDDAVKLLCDLRDLGLRDGRAGEVEARLRQLGEDHARKVTLIERLQKAGLSK